jgi:hypothetical protein
MEDEPTVDALVGYGPAPQSNDARFVIDFGPGPDGVGPVMGFDSGEFFRPPVPEAIESDGTDVQ